MHIQRAICLPAESLYTSSKILIRFPATHTRRKPAFLRPGRDFKSNRKRSVYSFRFDRSSLFPGKKSLSPRLYLPRPVHYSLFSRGEREVFFVRSLRLRCIKKHVYILQRAGPYNLASMLQPIFFFRALPFPLRRRRRRWSLNIARLFFPRFGMHFSSPQGPYTYNMWVGLFICYRYIYALRELEREGRSYLHLRRALK